MANNENIMIGSFRIPENSPDVKTYHLGKHLKIKKETSTTCEQFMVHYSDGTKERLNAPVYKKRFVTAKCENNTNEQILTSVTKENFKSLQETSDCITKIISKSTIEIDVNEILQDKRCSDKVKIALICLEEGVLSLKEKQQILRNEEKLHDRGRGAGKNGIVEYCKKHKFFDKDKTVKTFSKMRKELTKTQLSNGKDFVNAFLNNEKGSFQIPDDIKKASQFFEPDTFSKSEQKEIAYFLKCKLASPGLTFAEKEILQRFRVVFTENTKLSLSDFLKQNEGRIEGRSIDKSSENMPLSDEISKKVK